MAIRSLLIGALLGFSSAAFAAGEAKAPKDIDFSFQTIFGDYDRASAQRGLQVYREVCSACHALDYIAFRNLAELGFNEAEVKALSAEYDIAYTDDYGDTSTRPGIPSDLFPSPFANPQAAAAANNGKVPPNLSLIVEARMGGADYIYSLLTGYHPEKDEELDPGLYYNDYYPGHAIAMAAPLYEDSVEFADGTPATVEQMAKDVTTFLAWASEPNMYQRKRMGVTTIIFLTLLTVLFYMSYKRVWAPVKKGGTPWKDKVEARKG